ncbi:MAG: hypothetical protein ACXVRE_03910 [Gaiellaceae bacterium]
MSEPLVLRGPEGSITLVPGALTQLVVTAAEGVEGARVRRPKRSVQVEHGTVSLGLAVAQGASLPGVAREVQERVAAAVAATCGLEVAVDVVVEAVA